MKLRAVLTVSILILATLFCFVSCQSSEIPSDTTETRSPQDGEDVGTKAETTEKEEGEPKMYLTYTDVVNRMLDSRRLSQNPSGETSAEFTTYDRSSQVSFGKYSNWNANLDHHGILAKTEEGEVAALIQGAGYLSRIWSAAPKNGHIKIYIDDETTPRIDMPFVQLFSGAVAPFDFPALSYRVAEGYNCYVPITFSKSCRVILSGDWGDFYHIGYTTFDENTEVEAFPTKMTQNDRAALTRVNDFFANRLGTNPIEGGTETSETVTVSKETPYRKTLSGSGAIAGLTVKLTDLTLPSSEETVSALKNLKLRIYYDGAKQPSVEVPLGDFFGCSYGITEIRTLLYGVRRDLTLYNYCYMPFADGAVIEILANDGYCVGMTVSLTTEELSPEDVGTMRFCALFNRGEYHESADRQPDYAFLKASGSGRLIGLTLHVYKHNNYRDPDAAPGDEWWGEGDEKFFVDGKTFPSWFGTGTEDFFGYAWCSGEVFSRAFHSQSYNCGQKLGVGNRVLTRLFVLDNVPFSQSFEGYLEKYYSEAYASYAFTTCFYLDVTGTVSQPSYDFEDYTDYFKLDPAYVINEAEALPVVENDGLKPMIQDMSGFGKNWSSNRQLFWVNDYIGNHLTLSLPALADGEYVLLASFTKATNYGIYTVAVNGTALDGSYDLYSTVVEANTLTELGSVVLSKENENTFTICCVGKNERSTGFYFGLDFLMLIPKEEYEGLASLNLTSYLRRMDDIVRLNAVCDRFVITDGDRRVATAELLPPTTGTLSLQNVGYHSTSYTNDYHVWWQGGGVGAELSATITAETDGLFDGTLALTTAGDFGTVQLYVNGTLVGTYDCYHNGVMRFETALNGIALREGSNTLTFRISGKNPVSSGYLFGLDHLTLAKR